MKRILAAGGATLVLAAVAGVVAAQPAQPQAQRGAERAQPVAQAQFVERRVARLQALDANADGVVTAEERRAGQQARHAERITQTFDRLDANRDGLLSREEFAARPAAGGAGADRAGPRGKRMAARAERRMDRPVNIADARARAEQQFARLDANGDGTVTVEERRAAMTQMREQRRERRAARPTSPAAPGSE
jgi:Ca2+-binding EF-hand superfamily protein